MQRFAIHAGKTEVEIAWQAIDRVPVQANFGYTITDSRKQTFSQRDQPGGLIVPLSRRNLKRQPERDDERHRQRAAAQAALMSTAV